MFGDAVNRGSTSKSYFSRIARGGLHLSRLIPFKDVIIPSGPLSSFMGTAFNLTNSTIGAGVLGFGVVFSRLGIALAPFIALIILIVQITSNSLVLRAAKKCEARSLPVVAFRTFGKVGAIALDVIMIISLFGTLCAYFIIIADFLLPVASAFLSPTSLLASSRIVAMLFIGLLGILPLSLRPSINSLESFSMMSIILVLLVVIGVIVLSAIEVSNPPNPSLSLAKLDLNSIGALSIIFFAFSNTSNVMPIFVEMKIPTRKQFNAVQILSGSLILVVYVLAGALSYAAYGNAVAGNLLTSLPPSEVTILMQLGFLFTIIFTYPLILFPARLAVEHLLLGIRRQFTPLESSTCSVVLIAGSFGVAVATQDVDIVFGLTGAIGFSLQTFFFPGIWYLKSCGLGRSKDGALTKNGVYLAIVAVLIAIWGIVALIIGIISWVTIYF